MAGSPLNPLCELCGLPHNKTGNRSRFCEPCQTKKRKACTARWWRKNGKAHKASRKDQSKSDMLRFRYGMSREDYLAILAAQKGVCAVCRKPERLIDDRTKEPRQLSVDHDHVTNKVRGILCHKCNIGLSNFNDDTELFDIAKDYLLRHVTSPHQLKLL